MHYRLVSRSILPFSTLFIIHCLTPHIGPSYTGARPPGACVGVDINQTVVEQAIFLVGCSGVTLQDVLTTSPPGMARGAITQSSTNPLQYTMTMTWTAPSSAWGKSCPVHANEYDFMIVKDRILSATHPSTILGNRATLNV